MSAQLSDRTSLRPTTRLRQLLARPGAIMAPGVVDPLYARLVTRHGFDAMYMTGAGTSASRLGMPDIGLLTLTEDEAEVYDTPEAGDEGSPLAQTLFGVDGIRALTITDSTLLVTRDPDAPWEAIVDEVRDALRDFFL